MRGSDSGCVVWFIIHNVAIGKCHSLLRKKRETFSAKPLPFAYMSILTAWLLQPRSTSSIPSEATVACPRPPACR